MLKKWIALALSMVMLLTVLPFDVWADPEPTTAAAQPAEQTTPEQPATSETPAEEEETPKPKLEPLSAAQAAIPTHKLPTKAARIQRLRYYIQWDHQNALEQEDRESLYGFCGLLASYQLFYRGINTWRRCNDGKDYFDTYSVMPVTDGGYTTRAYSALKEQPKEETPAAETAAPEESAEQTPATETVTPSETTGSEAVTEQTPESSEPEKYTIEQILNQVTNHGTKEVYNLLVCFERTSTAAGTIYGHVVFVYGIIDGMVYFTEGGNMFGVEAGEPMVCSISQFSASYATWTDFEGVVVFGNKDFLDNCAVYTSNFFAVCTEDAPLLPLPTQADSNVLRVAAKGERLQVIALYQNRDQEYYYEIYDGGSVCYTPVDALKPILFLQEPFVLEEPTLPQVLDVGKDLRLDGTLETLNYMSKVRVSVLDAQGTVLQEFTKQVNESSFDLYDWELNKVIDFAALPEGVYTCRIDAESCNWFVFRGNLAKRYHTETVAEQLFAVGEGTVLPAPAEAPPVQTVKDGWIYEDQTWYCYDQGTPLTGWLQADGVWYYLQADGAVTTGWVLVEGQLKLFTGTGALRTGWVDSQMGRKYMLQDGSAAQGWRQINGVYYYFNELGIWQEDYMRNTLNRMAQLDMTPAVEAYQSAAVPQEE